MSRLSKNYTITYANNSFTLTYSDTYSPVTIAGNNYDFIPTTGNYFLFGTPGSESTLDYTKCTSPSGSVSVSNLGTKVASLITTSGSFTSPTLTTPTIISPTFNPAATISGVSFAWAGAGATGSTGSSSFSLTYTMIGPYVHVKIPAFGGANGAGGTGTFFAASAVPTGFRPTIVTMVPCVMSVNGAWQGTPVIAFQTNGDIIVYQDPSTNPFPVSNSVAVKQGTYIYVLT
jgi:hypothetical protein